MRASNTKQALVRSVRIATLATLWLVPLFLFVSAFSSDWVSTWRAVGVPSMTPKFLDLYSIPTGVETLHNGGDPLVANPGDPYHRPMNYPRIWLYAFSAAGVTRDKIPIVALVLCAFYLACISVLIARTAHAVDAVVILVASLSAAPLLAMERGNNDLFVFLLVFLACFATHKYFKSGLFGAAALLKLYPIVAMIVDGLRRPTKERKLAALLILLTASLVLLQWRDLGLIRHGTQASRTWSYGVLSLEAEAFHESLQRGGALVGLEWIVVLECWLMGALAIRYAWRNSAEPDPTLSDPKFAELFSAFGGIYVFTYAIGSNWDYRLIFLLPTLPLAMEMVRGARHRLWAITYLVFVGIAENPVAARSLGGIFASQAATFALFILLLIMLTNQAKSLHWKRAAAAPAAAWSPVL
jgi:Glycosyltransferase family 87